jgi:protein SCO1/2
MEAIAFWMRLAGLTLTGCFTGALVLAAHPPGAITPLPSFERVMVPAAPKVISDFELTDQTGATFRFSSLQGEPALVFFGFAHCPDVCPAALAKLKLLKQSADHELRQVRVVMISVDGERDTPESMREYLARFAPDFIGLTGDPRKVREIAAQFSAVFFKGQPRDTSGNYVIEHTSQVYAVDKSGRVRAEFYDASIEAITGVTKALLNEPVNRNQS